MGFADELQEIAAAKPTLAEWLLTLEPADRAAFDEVVLGPVEPKWEPLTRLVRKHGAATTEVTLKRYRADRVSRG